MQVEFIHTEEDHNHNCVQAYTTDYFVYKKIHTSTTSCINKKKLKLLFQFIAAEHSSSTTSPPLPFQHAYPPWS